MIFLLHWSNQGFCTFTVSCLKRGAIQQFPVVFDARIFASSDVLFLVVRLRNFLPPQRRFLPILLVVAEAVLRATVVVVVAGAITAPPRP